MVFPRSACGGQVVGHAARADRTVAAAKVGVGEVDELLALGGDRHRGDDEVDHPVLQVLDGIAEFGADQRAADMHLLAQGAGDVDIEAAEAAELVERGERRRSRSTPTRSSRRSSAIDGATASASNALRAAAQRPHRSAADPLAAGAEPAQGGRPDRPGPARALGPLQHRMDGGGDGLAHRIVVAARKHRRAKDRGLERPGQRRIIGLWAINSGSW